MRGDPWVIVTVAAIGAIAGAFVPLITRRHETSPATWLTAIVTGGLFALAGWRLGGDWRVIPVLLAIIGLVALAIVDVVHYRLPDKILFPTLGLVVAGVVIGELADGGGGAIGRAALGAVVYSVFLFVMHLISPAGLGFGDVKLGVLLGWLLGWVAGTSLDAVRNVLAGLLLGSMGGVVVGAMLYALRRAGVRALVDPDRPEAMSTFPFGPALIAAGLAVVLFA